MDRTDETSEFQPNREVAPHSQASAVQTSASVSEVASRRTAKRIELLRTVLGSFAILLAAERCRANPRLSRLALGLVVAFLVLFVSVFVLANVILLPGVLLIFIVVDAIIPRRYLAVTDSEVVVTSARFWTDRPKNIIAAGTHADLRAPRGSDASRTVKIVVGAERLKLRHAQYQCLIDGLTDSADSNGEIRSSTGLLPSSREKWINAAVVGLIVLSAVVEPHLRIAKSQTPSVTASPAERAMGGWVTSYGEKFQAVARDAGGVGADFNAPNLDTNSLRADCVKLGADVQQAMTYPAMPAASLEGDWASVLANLDKVAPVCVSGVDRQNSPLLQQAQLYVLGAEQGYLKLLKAAQHSGL